MPKLKILHVNRFFNQKIAGGALGGMLGLMDIFMEKGHSVIPFSMKHPENPRTPYQKYFVDYLPIAAREKSNLQKLSLTQKARLFPKIIYSREAAQKLEQLIQQEGRPDIAHLHIFGQYLTPSIIPVLKKHRIPIVQTLHNYLLICPKSLLFNQQGICEKCRPKKYYQCLLNKCVQDSALRSGVAMFERYFNRVFFDYEKNIDLFIAPSQFMKEKTAEFGIDPKKIKTMLYYLDFAKTFGAASATTAPSANPQEPPYALYFGRLSPEKDLATLIQAFALIKNQTLQLKIAGTGESEKSFKKLVKKLKLEKRVVFLGFKERNELTPLIQDASFTLYPPRWYENSPLSIYESFYFKKPVIASAIGGNPELVKDGQRGLLFTPQNPQSLAQKIDSLDAGQAAKMGAQAQKWVLAKTDKEKYYQNLLQLYTRLLT